MTPLICLMKEALGEIEKSLSYELLHLLFRHLAPASPGEMLQEEFLKPLGLSKYRLAKSIDVPAQRIGDIVSGKRGITADTNLRLCRFFSLSDGWWSRLQVAHDTVIARRKLGKA